MKNNFDLNRFTLLFKKHTSEHIAAYSMSTLALFGFLFACVLFFSTSRNSLVAVNFQRDIFFFFLWTSGCIFTSNVFADLGNNKKASAILMLPASHFEKFLVNWIYSYLIFQVVFVGVFYLVLFISSSLVHFQGKEYQIYNLAKDLRATSWIFLSYMVLHAISFAGSVYFKKLHLIKTAIAFFALFAIVVPLNEPLMELFLNRDVAAPMPFFRIIIEENNNIFRLDLRKSQKVFLMLIPVVLAGMVWTTTYFRLKEKEI